MPEAPAGEGEGPALACSFCGKKQALVAELRREVDASGGDGPEGD